MQVVDNLKKLARIYEHTNLFLRNLELLVDD